jgi:hypothetical protein
MKLRKHTKQLTGTALVGALLLPAAALANEAHIHGIAYFGDTGANQCTGVKTHKVHNKTAEVMANYFNHLKNHGKWSDVRLLNNSNARAALWTDPAKGSASTPGWDTLSDSGVDDANVFFVHTHGGHRTSPARSWITMGNNADACNAITDVHMRLGNGKLNIAIVKACQSGNIEVFELGGYRAQMVPATSGMSIWNAFHGDSSCGNKVKRYLDDYTETSQNDGIGENWIDEAHDWGIKKDDCPVSIVFGASEAQRLTMFEKGGWRDRKNTGSKTGSSYFGLKGCDPSGGRKL